MTVERETAGFVLPFAAGTIAATLIATHIAITQVHCTIPILITVAGFSCLIHPSHKTWNWRLIQAIICIVAISCGIWTGFSDKFISISSPGYNTTLTGQAEVLCCSLKCHIDNIPFRNNETAEIIKALITGERSGISRETITAFRSSGASHILALSGLHLGIIYGIITRILSVAGNNTFVRIIRSALIVSLCGIYTLATGAGASITRAFLFVTIGEIALLNGRKRDLGDILLASLFIQLVIWPESATDIGFQLSYAAMAGIAFIFPRLKKFLREDKVPKPVRWVWNSAAMSISCQLTTGPLAYCYFGTFPEYFLLTNLIALPLAGLIIPAALLTIVLHMIGICPEFMIVGTEILVRALTESLKTISQM